jgi:hypothetical protein
MPKLVGTTNPLIDIAAEKDIARVSLEGRESTCSARQREVLPAALREPNRALPVKPKQTEQEIQGLRRYIRQKLTEIEQVYQYSPVGLVLMDMPRRSKRRQDVAPAYCCRSASSKPTVRICRPEQTPISRPSSAD